jgi:hypothetical protein
VFYSDVLRIKLLIDKGKVVTIKMETGWDMALVRVLI